MSIGIYFVRDLFISNWHGLIPTVRFQIFAPNGLIYITYFKILHYRQSLFVINRPVTHSSEVFPVVKDE